MTTPERTAFDLARRDDPVNAIPGIDAMLARHLVTKEEVMALAAARRLGVEYDGDQHRTRAVFRNDLRRLNDLRSCGWTVLRFAAADLHNPGKVTDTVKRSLRAA
jgi:very-short-patch-repair endonuclease